MNRRFTIVLPVRDTDSEYSMLTDSLAAGIALNPDQVTICLDSRSDRIMSKAKKVAEIMNFQGLEFLVIPPSPEWNFQLAQIVWNAYRHARNDLILSYDVDSVPYRRSMLKGLDIVGHNNVAVVSFRKFLSIRSMPDLIRMFFYWFHTNLAEKPFSGIYFIDRRAYYEMVKEYEMRSIRNGIDTMLVRSVQAQDRYRMVCLHDLGCYCLTPQNEDYKWRQVQDGLWAAANRFKQSPSHAGLLGRVRSLINLVLTTGILVLTTGVVSARPILTKALLWGTQNPDLDVVKRARGRDFQEYVCDGIETLKGLAEID